MRSSAPRPLTRLWPGQSVAGPVALALLAALVVATPVLAGQTWTLAASPTAVPAGVATEIQWTARNTSGSSGSGESISCVQLAVPAVFAVVSTRIVSVDGGHAWSVSSLLGTVSAHAAAAGDALQGGTASQAVVIGVTVIGSVPGSYSWTGNELKDPACLSSYNRPIGVTISVAANLPPVALPDTYSGTENQVLNTAAPGVLANDTDPEGQPLTALLVTGPIHGSLSLNANGSFRYTPAASFWGIDTFTYRAQDPQGNTSPPITVTLTIAAVATPTPTPGPTPTPRPTPTPTPSSGASTTPSPGQASMDPGSQSPSAVAVASGSAPATPTPTPEGSSPARPGQGPSAGGTAPGPSSTPALLAVAGSGSGAAPVIGFHFAGISLDLLIPPLVLSVPGLLLVLAISAQLAGAFAWVPAVRRYLDGEARRADRRRRGSRG
jgi:cell division septation protein DedD